jgi:hypothetical protein
MKYIVTLVLALAASQAMAAPDAQPTDESVKQLLQAMHSSSLVDTLMKQVEGTVRGSMQQAVAGQQPNAQQQKILSDMQGKIFALVKEQLNWADLEPMMIEIYRNTFTQVEVDGMLKFYRSEVGQAAVAKLPAATQQTMASVQGRMQTLTPKIMQLEKEAAAQLKAAGEAHPGAPQPPSPH